MKVSCLMERDNFTEFRNELKTKKLALCGTESFLKQALCRYLFDSKGADYIIETGSKGTGAPFLDIPHLNIGDITENDMADTIVLLCGGPVSKIINRLLALNIGKVYSAWFMDPFSETVLEKRHISDMVRNCLSDEKSVRIFNSLLDKRMDANNDYSDIYEKNAYFNDIFANSITEDEVYLDCGSYNITSISDFIGYVKNKYRKIYAFEPTEYNFKSIQKLVEYNSKIEVVPYAVSDAAGTAEFHINDSTKRVVGGNSAVISLEGGQKNNRRHNRP